MLKITNMSADQIEYLSFDNGVMVISFKNIKGYVRYDSVIYHHNSEEGGRVSKNTVVGKQLKVIKYYYRELATVSDLCVIIENGVFLK